MAKSKRKFKRKFLDIDSFRLSRDENGNVLVYAFSKYLLDIPNAKILHKALGLYLSHIDEKKIKIINKEQTKLANIERQELHNKMMARIRPCNVYIMVNGAGHYKIGRSSDVPRREKTLQSQEPDIKLIYSFEGNSKDEAFLHKKFNTQRIRGEWFNLSELDISFIKDYLQSK